MASWFAFVVEKIAMHVKAGVVPANLKSGLPKWKEINAIIQILPTYPNHFLEARTESQHEQSS